MKCLALGLSTSAIVFFAAAQGAAQNAPTPPKAAETAQTPPATPSAQAPAQPPPVSPSNPAAPNPGPGLPAANPAPAPTFPYAPYGYPPYGAPNGYANGYGWAMPPEPPKEINYSGGPIPYGYKLEERRSLGLLIAGPTLFALGYLAAVFTANDKPGGFDFNGNPTRAPWDVLYIPLSGPFAFSGYAPGGSAFIYVFEGLAQVAGAGMFLGGLLFPKSILVRQYGQDAFVPTLHVGAGNVQLQVKF